MRLLLCLALCPQLLSQLPTGPAPLMPGAIRARFTADLHSKNLDDVLELYTADATFHSPDVSTISGTAAIRKLYETVFARYDADITLDPPQHHEIGEPRHFTGIIETGRYHEQLTDRASHQTQLLCGAYTFTYTRNPSAGGWLVSQMDWTTEPCPAQSSAP